MIHQIWLGQTMPTHIKAWIIGVQDMNQGIKHKLWTDQVAEDTFPYFKERRHDFTDGTESDLLRYLIIQKFGGLYLDADMIAYRPIGDLLEQHQQFSCEEIVKREVNRRGPRKVTTTVRLCNSVIYSKKPNPSWCSLLLAQLPDGPLNFGNCGSHIFSGYAFNRVHRLTADYFNPIHHDPLKWNQSEGITQQTRCIHAYLATWNPKLAKKI